MRITPLLIAIVHICALVGVATPALAHDARRAPSAQPTSSFSTLHTRPIESGVGTLADCMSLWEPATHMSKIEWRATCRSSIAMITAANVKPLQHRSVDGSEDRSQPVTTSAICPAGRNTAPR